MRRNILALTTLLTATLTLSSAHANEQTDSQDIANRYQPIMKAAVKDASYDVSEHLSDAVLMNSGTMLASKLTKTSSSEDTPRQQNNQVLNSQLTKKLAHLDARSTLVGTWRASVFENGTNHELFWIIRPNGTSEMTSIYPDGTRLTEQRTWSLEASPLSGIIIAEVSATYGTIIASSISFINPNHFDLTVLHSYATPVAPIGLKLHYYRYSP